MTMVKEVEVSRVAKLISQRVEELKCVRTQKEISQIVGYTSANLISMLKTGETKLSIDRVHLMAKALEVEPRVLMHLALEQFFEPRIIRDMMEYFGSPVTPNEMVLIDTVRSATNHTDPVFDDKTLFRVQAAVA